MTLRRPQEVEGEDCESGENFLGHKKPRDGLVDWDLGCDHEQCVVNEDQHEQQDYTVEVGAMGELTQCVLVPVEGQTVANDH